jgi:energy-converting hydrogenase Eha subunit F
MIEKVDQLFPGPAPNEKPTQKTITPPADRGGEKKPWAGHPGPWFLAVIPF